MFSGVLSHTWTLLPESPVIVRCLSVRKRFGLAAPAWWAPGGQRPVCCAVPVAGLLGRACRTTEHNEITGGSGLLG